MMEWQSICLLATLRDHELQSLNARERLAAEARASRGAQPGFMATARIWFGSALVSMGTRLQGITEIGRTPDAFGSPEHAGSS
jgi:hypothetical protein